MERLYFNLISPINQRWPSASPASAPRLIRLSVNFELKMHPPVSYAPLAKECAVILRQVTVAKAHDTSARTRGP
jgi:hypothetical protein